MTTGRASARRDDPRVLLWSVRRQQHLAQLQAADAAQDRLDALDAAGLHELPADQIDAGVAALLDAETAVELAEATSQQTYRLDATAGHSVAMHDALLQLLEADVEPADIAPELAAPAQPPTPATPDLPAPTAQDALVKSTLTAAPPLPGGERAAD